MPEAGKPGNGFLGKIHAVCYAKKQRGGMGCAFATAVVSKCSLYIASLPSAQV